MAPLCKWWEFSLKVVVYLLSYRICKYILNMNLTHPLVWQQWKNSPKDRIEITFYSNGGSRWQDAVEIDWQNWRLEMYMCVLYICITWSLLIINWIHCYCAIGHYLSFVTLPWFKRCSGMACFIDASSEILHHTLLALFITFMNMKFNDCD